MIRSRRLPERVDRDVRDLFSTNGNWCRNRQSSPRKPRSRQPVNRTIDERRLLIQETVTHTLAELLRDPDDGLEIRDDVRRELCESLPARSIRLLSIRFPAPVSFRAPHLPPFLHVVDGLLRHPIHGGTSLVFRRHAHADEEREPPSLVIMQAILCWSVHHVLLRGRWVLGCRLTTFCRTAGTSLVRGGIGAKALVTLLQEAYPLTDRSGATARPAVSMSGAHGTLRSAGRYTPRHEEDHPTPPFRRQET